MTSLTQFKTIAQYWWMQEDFNTIFVQNLVSFEMLTICWLAWFNVCQGYYMGDVFNFMYVKGHYIGALSKISLSVCVLATILIFNTCSIKSHWYTVDTKTINAPVINRIWYGTLWEKLFLKVLLIFLYIKKLPGKSKYRKFKRASWQPFCIFDHYQLQLGSSRYQDYACIKFSISEYFQSSTYHTEQREFPERTRCSTRRSL